MRYLLATFALILLPVSLAAQGAGVRWGPTTFAAQANFVWQGYPTFPAGYTGALSLPTDSELRNTRVFTLFTTTRLGNGWAIELDLESANGHALGDSTGLAGITNLDVTRSLDTSLAPVPYIARLYAAHSLGSGTLRIGRLALADTFDQNSVLGNSHQQFMNWSFNANPAWDYAADTRGYTDAMVMSWGGWQIAYALMSRIQNGFTLDWRSTEIVAERRFLWRRFSGSVLGYDNRADMGRYDQAETDVTTVRRYTWKPGVGADLEYALRPNLHFGARLGANDDAVQEFEFTEVGNSASAGMTWKPGNNLLGAAFASNGISAAHAAYLARGGMGFLLGDGGLRYGRESIEEVFWTRPLDKHLVLGPDLQWIHNPGYNRDRGPVLFYGWRLHLDF